MIREPEFRLPGFIPFALIEIGGMIALAVSAQKGDSWAILVFVAYFLSGFGILGASVIALAYALDSYPKYAGEIMLLATVMKNSLACKSIPLRCLLLDADP